MLENANLDFWQCEFCPLKSKAASAREALCDTAKCNMTIKYELCHGLIW